MCKRCCKFSKLPDGEAFYSKIPKVKQTKYHWIAGALITIVIGLWAVLWDTNMYGIEYKTDSKLTGPAIEISGIDFQSEDIQLVMNNLSDNMKKQCIQGSIDVLFGFQFTRKDTVFEDHIFYLCNARMSFGNAKVIRKSTELVMCTEELNGELVEKVRPKEVTIKAIDLKEWKQIQYTSANAKESCIIQHAIDVLELKWV